MTQAKSNDELLASLQKSLIVIEKLEKELAKTREDIAVIGMSCRFPGAESVEAFWDLLRAGGDAITEVPPARWDADAYYDPNPDAIRKMYCRYGGFLDQVDQFDPLFFGISPREALRMDPQQRLLLEVSWEALENAGQSPRELMNSRAGVFVGIAENDFALLINRIAAETDFHHYDATGTGFSFAAGRLSHVLGLQGPNLAIDTACSSSLVAIHQAVMSLRFQECDLALAGGVHLRLAPDTSLALSKTRALAPDGRCKTFDASADGFSRSEGCGVIVLKRLSDAQAHGDNILCVIRGSAVNHDGPASGFTVPNEQAQESLIRDALKNARVGEGEVSYIEAHGTGTALGDPIEVGALAEVFGKRKHPLFLGSVKANIGHLEGAAGVAGVIKTVLALRHAEIPPQLHFKEPNPHIDWNDLPFVVPTELRAWPVPPVSKGGRRIAGVSSFSMSGTNAHLVLAEAPPRQARTEIVERPSHILTVSAKSESALRELAGRYEAYLSAHPDADLADLCYSANTGRAHFDHRLCLVAHSTHALRRALAACALDDTSTAPPIATVPALTHSHTPGPTPLPLRGYAPSSRPAPKVAFLFPGQGAQYHAMGHDLYLSQPTFRRALERCADILDPLLDRPLLDLLYGHHNPAGLLDRTAYAQPALFALEYALAQLWRSWGVEPDILLGHSVGEYAAACVAGIFSLEDGLRLVAERGRLMQELPAGGAMASVEGGRAQVEGALGRDAGRVVIAAENGPQSMVISGAGERVREVVETLTGAGVRCRMLAVSHAFHSPLVEPMLGRLAEAAGSIRYGRAEVGLVSNVTGEEAGAGEMGRAEYWVRQARERVRFGEGVRSARRMGAEVFVEVGPGATLLGLGRGCVVSGESMEREKEEAREKRGAREEREKEEAREDRVEREKVGVREDRVEREEREGGEGCEWLASMRRGRGWEQMLESVGRMYVRGVGVEWRGFEGDYAGARRRVELPTYPFQRKRYWPDHQVEPREASHRTTDWHDWLLTLNWQPRELEPAFESSRATAGSWLIIADDRNTGIPFARELRSRGHRCMLTVSGAACRSPHSAASEQTASVCGAEHYRKLLADAGDGFTLTGVLYIARGDEATAVTERVAALSCDLLHLTQAVSGIEPAPPRVWVVTRNAQAVAAGEFVDVEYRPLWGLARAVSAEHPELRCTCIDLDVGDSERHLPIVLAELLAGDEEDQIAVRAGVRYVARLGRRGLQSRMEGNSTVKLRKDCSYLVTGGLGGLGLQVARRLAEEGAGHLILAGRRGISSAEAREAVRGLERAGASVRVVEADVSVEADVARVIFACESEGPLRGVVHAAGVLDDGVLSRQTAERFGRVLEPKVRGGWHLHRLTQGKPLDFFVAFSSIASLLETVGAGSYAAANAFLDGLMQQRRAMNLPGLSINWGPWAGVGMAASAAERFQKIGLEMIAPEQGARIAVALALSASDRALAQVCVVAADWEQFHQTLFQGRPANILNELTREKKQPATLKRQSVRAESHKASARQQLDSASDKRQFLEAHVKAQLMETLGSKEPLDLREGFFDLGMDSLMAMEFQERLQSTLECTLPTTLTFKYPRVEALVDYLAQVILTEKPAARTDTALETARREADALAREVHSLSPQELMAQILEKFEKHQ